MPSDPTAPVTPRNDAVLREWSERVIRAYSDANVPSFRVGALWTPETQKAYEERLDAAAARLRSLCEAVAAAERKRCAANLDDVANTASHGQHVECEECRVFHALARRIRSLRGLPEIGRPRE